MNEDALTRVQVSLVGVRNWTGLLRLFAAEGTIPVGDSDSAVWLCVGDKAVSRVLGRGWKNEVTALRKYKDQRAQRRSAWEPYCVRREGRWIVTCAVPSRTNRARVVAAVRWALHLESGGDPVSCGKHLSLPKEWA